MKRKEDLTIEELIRIIDEEIDEPRQKGGNMRHKLVDILVIVLVGIVCGCEQWIENRRFCPLLRPQPSQRHAVLPHPCTDDVQLALLSFATCSTHDFAVHCHMLSDAAPYIRQHPFAVCGFQLFGLDSLHDTPISVIARKPLGTPNEIMAIPELLELLDIQGASVTIDAMAIRRKSPGKS